MPLDTSGVCAERTTLRSRSGRGNARLRKVTAKGSIGFRHPDVMVSGFDESQRALGRRDGRKRRKRLAAAHVAEATMANSSC